MKNTLIITFLITFFALCSNNIHAQNNSFNVGKKAFASQDYYKAIEIFTNILNTTPNNTTVRYYLGQSYYKSKECNKASKEFTKIYNTAPESLEGKYSKVALDQIRDLQAPVSWTKKLNLENKNAQSDNYLKEVAVKGKYVRWNLNSMPLRIYIEQHPQNIQHFDPILIEYIKSGIEEWPKVTNGKVLYTYVNNKESADIVILWVNSEKEITGVKHNRKMFTLGVTQLMATSQRLYGAVIRMATSAPTGPKIPPAIFKGTAIHEMGHALGLQGHSLNSDDVMYYSSNPYNQRNKLTQDDIRTINMLYSITPDVTNAGSGQFAKRFPNEIK